MVVPLLAHQFESFFAFIDGKYLALKASAKWRQREEEEEETVESLNPPAEKKEEREERERGSKKGSKSGETTDEGRGKEPVHGRGRTFQPNPTQPKSDVALRSIESDRNLHRIRVWAEEEEEEDVTRLPSFPLPLPSNKYAKWRKRKFDALLPRPPLSLHIR